MSEADLIHTVASTTQGSPPTPITAAVAAAGTTSGAVDYRQYNSGLLVLPAGLLSTACTYLISADGTHFFPLYDGAGSLITTTLAASESVPLPSQLASAAYFKLVMGTPETLGATITLALKS